MFKGLLCLTAACCVVAPASSAEWMVDLEAAKAKAAAEGKSVLVDFTGSDWCHYCKRLRKEVLDTPAFEAYAAGKFVLVEVDVPRYKKDFDRSLLERNRRLCKQFHVQGYPTLLVLTPEGVVVGGMTGFRPQLAQVQEPLDAALANAGTLRQALQAEGAEKVRLLRHAYEALPPGLREASSLQGVLMENDPESAARIQEERDAARQMREIQARLQAVAGDERKYLAQLEIEVENALPANKPPLEGLLERLETVAVFRELNAMHDDPTAALAYLDKKLEKAKGSLRTMVLGLKLDLQLKQAKTVEDVLEAKATMQQVLDATPDDEVLRRQAEEMFADPEALLKR